MPEAVFEGVKVLDFCWVIVGPLTTKFLADHGATVIRVESVSRADVIRSNAPFKDRKPGINRSAFFPMFNTGKMDLGLNLGDPRARDLVRLLIEQWQPDIVSESFAPGTMARLGLDYKSVREIKPDIIYFSTTQLGQTGPFARYAGFGNIAMAISGFSNVTGWPDGSPIGPYGAVPDMINPPLAVSALIAALDYRRRTGKGQHIDLSQIEGSLQFLAPALLDYTVNGRIPERQGNRDADMAPHGVFPCLGDDRWIAIAVRDDSDWRALCGLARGERWAADEEFATLAGRKSCEETLEQAIGAWTAGQDREALMLRLQRVGVPAAAVKDCVDLVNDPQLRHMDFFQTLEHVECGPMPYDGPHFRLSRTPAILTAGPTVGQHNFEVLNGILGLSLDEIAELVAEGVIESP